MISRFLRVFVALAAGVPLAWAQSPSIGETDIGGVVRSAGGPEAGVWVIAETTDLPTKFAKIVVTDDQGRYVIPDLPKATYNVWVRGYGLVDSPKLTAAPGKPLDIQALPAPTEAAAASYYPSIYWLTMLDVPAKSEFPGTGSKGNNIPPDLKTQSHWLDGIKTHGCNTCHQLGNLATRTFVPGFRQPNESSADAWFRRIHSGQSSELMLRNIGRLDVPRAMKYFGDWTDRIAAGELPFAKPQRPQGVERNIVVSMWDWSRPYVYIHDEIGTDKRNPRVNANGPLYGAPEWSSDYVPVFDPRTNTAREIKLPVRDPRTITSRDDPMYADSPYWGAERIYDSQTSPHNPMMDHKARAWFTSRIRNIRNPEWCEKGDHPSTKALPMTRSVRQLSFYDPATQKVTLIDTCFSTHHLQFAEDENNTLWLSTGFGGNGGNEAIGWLNTKMFDETGDEKASQGWTALVLDTNGNGKRDAYVGPRDAIDPTKDKRILLSLYGIAYSPVDGSIWGSVASFPGGVARIAPGADPANTALTEYYEVPFDDPRAPLSGYAPRGLDVDRQGVAWVPLASGHMASFDRRKCKVTNGPTATGKHCPEGWTLYPFPVPQYRNVTESGSAESSYFTWVDQHDTFGLGRDVPIATGNLSDSLHALVDGKWIELRVPYPMGFFSKGMDGRIDDPAAGWKGKALWSNYAERAPFHIEGGKGTRPKLVKFQLRPDPLAR